MTGPLGNSVFLSLVVTFVGTAAVSQTIEALVDNALELAFQACPLALTEPEDFRAAATLSFPNQSAQHIETPDGNVVVFGIQPDNVYGVFGGWQYLDDIHHFECTITAFGQGSEDYDTSLLFDRLVSGLRSYTDADLHGGLFPPGPAQEFFYNSHTIVSDRIDLVPGSTVRSHLAVGPAGLQFDFHRSVSLEENR